MSQLALDFTRTPYSEPGTSRDAALSIERDLDRLERVVLAALLAAGPLGLTDQEIESATRLAGNTVRPRRGSLVDLGLVEDTNVRRTTSSGRFARVWRVAHLEVE